MFTTFGIATPGSNSDPKTPPAQRRAKRAQVARACDWCRLTRVKCDNVRPCRNCKQTGRDCSSGGRDDFKTVAAATREVQRLRTQVEELEAKTLSPSSTWKKGQKRKTPKVRWQGVRIKGLHHGPSSLAYFVHRLSNFISMDLEIELPASNLIYSPLKAFSNCDRLQRSQQDYFLDLFWQGHHVIYPVLDEVDFRRHYDSLWESSSFRQPSPLVDIILALCIQFGSTYMSPRSDLADDSDQPGNEFYSRAQHHLHQEGESPSLVSVQCHFFSIIYLLAAGQVNTAYIMTGTAIRIAQSLGLHQTAVEQEAPEEELRLRWAENSIWNCLSILDIQLSLHFGRPFATHQPEPELLPSLDSAKLAQLMGPTFIMSPKSKIHWLTFQSERLRLFQLVRGIQEEFSAVCDDVLEEVDAPDFYHHPSAREKCAGFLIQEMKKLKEWTQTLPDDLKAARLQGAPLSVDRSLLDLDQEDPLWLQRQRLILELEYHNSCIILCWQFVTFLPTPALGTLSSDNNCISCVNHAIAATSILHQVLKDTDILTGWYQVIDWQRNAMFASAGFACGYPICPPTASSRKALASSAYVLNMSGSSKLADLARNLDIKAVEIIRSFTARLGISTPIISPFGEDAAEPASKTLTNVDSSAINFDFGALGDAINLDGIGLDPLWAGDGSSTSLLWGGFMKDMDRGLTSSIGEDMTMSMTDQVEAPMT